MFQNHAAELTALCFAAVGQDEWKYNEFASLAKSSLFENQPVVATAGMRLRSPLIKKHLQNLCFILIIYPYSRHEFVTILWGKIVYR